MKKKSRAESGCKVSHQMICLIPDSLSVGVGEAELIRMVCSFKSHEKNKESCVRCSGATLLTFINLVCARIVVKVPHGRRKEAATDDGEEIIDRKRVPVTPFLKCI